MSSVVASFSCGSCGRAFAWKNEYAGKTLKCKCGQPIKAPSAAPSVAAAAGGAVRSAPMAKAAPAAPPPPKSASVPTPAAESEDDFAKLVSDAEYELAAAPPPPPPTKRVTAVPAVAVATAAPGGPASPMLAYARAARKPDADEGTQRALVTDFYAPLILIVLGLAAYVFDAMLMRFHNPVMAGAFVVLNCLVNLILIFIALLIGVKVIDLGLGPIGTALLKITAVAVLPAALGDIILYYTQVGLASWGATLLMYYGLLYYLFELDGAEIYIVTSILWLVRMAMALLLIGLVVSLLGGGSTASGVVGLAGSSSTIGGAASGGGPQNPHPTYFPEAIEDAKGNEVPVKPSDVEKQADELLAAGKITEAKIWVSDAEPHHYSHVMNKKSMQQRVDQIYQAGAKKVYAAGIETVGPDDFVSQYLIELPDDPDARKSTFKFADSMNHATEPTKDDGRKYIVVPVD
jgi:hypothetical protein